MKVEDPPAMLLQSKMNEYAAFVDIGSILWSVFGKELNQQEC